MKTPVGWPLAGCSRLVYRRHVCQGFVRFIEIVDPDCWEFRESDTRRRGRGPTIGFRQGSPAGRPPVRSSRCRIAETGRFACRRIDRKYLWAAAWSMSGWPSRPQASSNGPNDPEGKCDHKGMERRMRSKTRDKPERSPPPCRHRCVRARFPRESEPRRAGRTGSPTRCPSSPGMLVAARRE